MSWPPTPVDGQETTQGDTVYVWRDVPGAWRKKDRNSTDLAVANVGASTLDITSSTGTAATLPAATGSSAGLMTSAASAKLAGIETGATADQAASEVPVTPTGNLSSTNTQAALNELQGDINALSPTVLRQNITGAATVSVTGRSALELTLTGNVTSLSFSGWSTSTSLLQRVRVQLVQDNTGGRTIDWRKINGRWVETPPDALPISPSGTTLQFYAITSNGGARVWLEPIGLEYGPGCPYMLANDVDIPAVIAADTVAINHSYSHVFGVELIEVATGQRVVAEWRRAVPTDPQSAILVGFDDAAPAGTWIATVAGVAAAPCDLTVSADSEWESVFLSTSAGGAVSPTVVHNGVAGDVQWVWGDGTSPANAVTNVATSKTLAAAATPVLRWKRGVRITQLDMALEGVWNFDLSAIRKLSDLQWLGVRGNPGVTGSLAALSGMTALSTLNMQDTAIAGSLNSVAPLTSLVTFNAYNTAIAGDVAALSGAIGLATLQLYNTDVSGDAAGLSTLTALSYLDISNTAVSGSTTAFAPLTNLTNLVIFNTDIVGPVSAFASLTNLTQLQAQLPGLTGDIAPLASLALLQILNLGGSDVDGDVATLAPLANLTRLYLQQTSVTGNPDPVVAAAVAQLRTLLFYSLEVAPAQTDLDTVLGTLAAGAVSNGAVDLSGTNPPITNTAAVATLQGRGWTVTHN